MTKEQLAAVLNGRTIGTEISHAEATEARKHGLVVVFGYSDDCMEFEGVLGHDQIDDDDDEAIADCVTRRKVARTINALWDPGGGYLWQYETDIPHATFEVVDKGEPCCRGIVFSVEKLGFREGLDRTLHTDV